MLQAVGTGGRLSRRAVMGGLARLGASAAGLAMIGGCGVLGSLTSQSNVRRIGFLVAADRISYRDRLDAFLDELRTLGWSDGHNLLIEWREANGRQESYPALAAELVHLPLELIVANSSGTLEATRAATVRIPIVIASVLYDPVQSGHATSLARPGGNVTGVISLAELAGKRVELLKLVVPHLSRLGMLRPEPADASVLSTRAETESAARVLGVETVDLAISDKSQALEAAFNQAAALGIDGLIANPGVTIQRQPERVAELTLNGRLPGVFNQRPYVAAGGLMSYGINSPVQYRRTASYVDRILRGAHPSELPIEQPTTFEFAANLKTAQLLGLTFPPDVAAQVTEWLQ
jgi:putative tryptophan/tyrosine transport system substrate-binding protein